MIFKDREQLCILEIEEDENKIAFDKLSGLLLDNPSNMVYCEKSGKLFGIISIGDVDRAKREDGNYVNINTSFTVLLGYEYVKARKLFLENESINALPIVDEENRLLGDYSRWDDVFSDYGLEFLKGNKYANRVWEKYSRVAIVHPSKQMPKKMKMMEVWQAFFESCDIEVEIIQKQDVIKAFGNKDMVLFIDEDERRGLEGLYHAILDKEFEEEKSKTLGSIEEAVEEAVGECLLKELMDRGIYILTLQILPNRDVYWKEIHKEIDARWRRIKKKSGHYVPEEFWEDFYDDLYSYEYANEMARQSFAQVKEGYRQNLKDVESTYYNVKNGERVTAYQPVEYSKTIYFFGACLMVGAYSEDKHTIESFLQKTLNEKGYKVKVVNCGCWSSEFLLLYRMLKTNFKKGDIVILFDRHRCFDGIPKLNLGGVLERNKAPARWFLDCMSHSNHKGNEMYAQAIYDALPKNFLEEKATDEIEKVGTPLGTLISAYIERYFGNPKKDEGIGSIVMNCNPFTYGHRFLIEESSKKVDRLIIFVVEENKSLFSFKERFAMVTEGTKDIPNVVVVPSGDFILSQQTFPQYFVKIEDKDVSRNAEFDIEIFAKEIAPRLNITYRFVGEEKKDAVTAEYNNAMKKILPQHGIELVEIPRKSKADGEPICATDVRTLLEEGKFDEVREFVPQTTYDILMKSWI